MNRNDDRIRVLRQEFAAREYRRLRWKFIGQMMSLVGVVLLWLGAGWYYATGEYARASTLLGFVGLWVLFDIADTLQSIRKDRQ